MKKRTQDRAIATAESLRSILDRQDDWIYVIDPDTHELKLLNANIKKLAPESREGMTCYRAFMSRESPCENCPVGRSGQEGPSIIENPNFRIRVRAAASPISWNGAPSCPITCQDLSHTP